MPGQLSLLIDGTAFCYRAFYAIRNLSTSDGRPTNAVYGFAVMLNALREKHHPAYLAVALDAGKPTFRHKQFADYKGQRPPMPDGLIGQLPLIKELLAVSNVPVFQKEGFEAEDLLATIARQIAAEGAEVWIVTGDKDALQLIGPGVKVFNPHKDSGLLLDAASVEERYGVAPERMVDLMALMGDAIDNIPGVPGIGEKTASELMRRFGSVDALLGRLDEVASPSLRASLDSHRKQVAMSRELARIRTDAPVQASLDALRVREPDWAALRKLYRRLEFRKLAAEVDAASPATAPAEMRVHLIDGADALKALRAKLRGTDPAGIAAWIADATAQPEADTLLPIEASPHAGAVALAWSGEEAWVVPIRRDAAWMPSITEWLASALAPKVGHDLKPTMRWLASLGFELRGVAGDTMLAGHLLNPASTSPTLDDLADEWLEERLRPMPASGVNGKPDGQQALAQRAAAIVRLDQRLQPPLQAAGLMRVYADIELPLVSVLAAMETRGVTLDPSVLAVMRNRMAAQIERLTATLFEQAGATFNPNSPKQLAEILFQRLKLPVIKRTKTGPSTDSEVLKQLAHQHPFVQTLIEFRELSKLVSTYIEALPKLIDPATGRLHTTFNQTGTSTGRLSSSDPNLQNIPTKTELGRQIRRAFVPQAGWGFVTADYSQIELRILAHLSGDAELIRAFREGRDIHRHTASLVYGVPEAEVAPEMRSAMKAINFGIIYGMSSHGLSQSLDIPREEAAKFIDAYFARYPKVRAFLDGQMAHAKQHGYVATMLGRRRVIPEVNSPDMAVRQFGERMAINAPIQGTAADLIKLAMVRLDEQLRAKGMAARLLLQVHDDLVLEAPPEERDALVALLVDVMEHAMDLSVPIRVVVKTGPNWLELTELSLKGTG